MDNRFLENDVARKAHGAKPGTPGPAISRARSQPARQLSASQRALVILIENGGVDLGIPELADKLLSALPGASALPESARQQVIVFLHDTLRRLTDNLLEGAELAINRYSAARPDLYDSVDVLRNGSATYADLKGKLISLSSAGRMIDLLILTHGREDLIAANGDINGAKIRQMRADYGKRLSIRSVYMMNCVGSSLNQAWMDAGAKVSSGSLHNNYLPEPTTYFFWQTWKAGQNFETAVSSAYRKTVNAMNEALQGFVGTLLGPIGALAASRFDFADMDFVKDSAPVIEGQRTLTIGSDELDFTQSMSSGLATTVLPVSFLRAMGRARASAMSGVEVSHSHSYVSPSTTMARREDVSRMQNPAAVVPMIAGIAVTDAAQIGLAAAAIVQTQVNASGGTFVLTYDKAQRLLTPDARAKMPGSQAAKAKYSRQLLYIGSASPIVDFAEANVVIEWEGNAYGEIGTPVIHRDLKTSTDWSRSSASVAITKLDRIPVAGQDPRAWPIQFNIEGNFDPVGNGQWEFTSEFEINAFGGLKFNKHEVVSRSLADFAIAGKPEDYVQKGKDVVVAMPALPQEQIAYLTANRPQ